MVLHVRICGKRYGIHDILPGLVDENLIWECGAQSLEELNKISKKTYQYNTLQYNTIRYDINHSYIAGVFPATARLFIG